MTSLGAIDCFADTEARLAQRPSRAPDLAGENAALLAMADEMTERPERVLQKLCDLTLKLCDAESAGVSLLRDEAEHNDFLWPAIAGAWTPYIGQGLPRDASPCGVVVDKDAVLVFQDVADSFPAVAGAEPPIKEVMLAPFHRHGRPIGTVWAISHNGDRQFDAEDKRLLTSIARFASAAYETIRAHERERAAQAQLTLVNQELGHRMKNMLSVVLAIATQTLKPVEQQDVVDIFRDRLQAFGAGHDILMQQLWSPAPIAAIVDEALETIGQQATIEAQGPPVTLGSKAAISLSMILHELGTNALKYGALSVPGGNVRLAWAISGKADDATITVTWTESDGPAVVPPAKRGFGTRLLSLGLLGQGGADLAYEPAGLRASFTAPLDAARSA